MQKCMKFGGIAHDSCYPPSEIGMLAARVSFVASIFILGLTFRAGQSAHATCRATVRVDRVVYLPGQDGIATVSIEGLIPGAEPVVIKSSLEHGLTHRISLPDVQINDPMSRTMTFPFTAP